MHIVALARCIQSHLDANDTTLLQLFSFLQGMHLRANGLVHMQIGQPCLVQIDNDYRLYAYSELSTAKRP